MPVVSFKASEVKNLIEGIAAHRKSGGKFSPTLGIMMEDENFIDNTPKDKNGKTKDEVEWFWPSAEYVKEEACQPLLQLVGDEGVYLMTNIKSDTPPSKSGLLSYAKGLDPHKDEDVWEKKRSVFGGDDGSIDIPLSWALWVVKNDKPSMRIRINKNSVSLVQN